MATNYKKEWEAVRDELIKHPNIYQYDETTWGKAIEKFKERLDNYFFIPISGIIERGDGDGEGFSVVTLQCALIEMFAAFKEGKIHALRRSSQASFHQDYRYSASQKLFTDFLKDSEFLGNYFSQSFDPNLFYKEVRCGLMHEARTKGKWLIRYKQEKLLTQDSNNNIIIDRSILQENLKDYLNRYIAKLKDPNETDLREKFARSLDNLFETIPTQNYQKYDWWRKN